MYLIILIIAILGLIQAIQIARLKTRVENVEDKFHHLLRVLVENEVRRMVDIITKNFSHFSPKNHDEEKDVAPTKSAPRKKA